MRILIILFFAILSYLLVFLPGFFLFLPGENNLLSENLNFDYLDTLIRKKLNFGNKDEVLIKLNE